VTLANGFVTGAIDDDTNVERLIARFTLKPLPSASETCVRDRPSLGQQIK